MSYDKMLYEAQKFWRKKQKLQRRLELEQARRIVYDENAEVIEIAKKAACIAVSLAKISTAARWLNVGDVLCRVNSLDELDFYYKWCCGRLE